MMTEMPETILALEDIVYMARAADSVSDLRRLDLLLRQYAISTAEDDAADGEPGK